METSVHRAWWHTFNFNTKVKYNTTAEAGRSQRQSDLCLRLARLTQQFPRTPKFTQRNPVLKNPQIHKKIKTTLSFLFLLWRQAHYR